MLEDADGSLLVVDTGSWYVHHCPTGSIRKTRAAGGIWRVRRAGADRPADPWGLKEDWAKAAPERLCELLADPRPAVRDRARLTLAARGKAAVPALAAALEKAADTAARQQVIWALAGMADESALPPLRQALDSSDPDTVATAARALAARADRGAARPLTRLLAAESVPVRFAAAEALARCGTAESLPAIWHALTKDPDRFLEHALIHAAHRLAAVADLEAALKHPHPRVQKAALHPPRPAAPAARPAVGRGGLRPGRVRRRRPPPGRRPGRRAAPRVGEGGRGASSAGGSTSRPCRRTRSAG